LHQIGREKGSGPAARPFQVPVVRPIPAIGPAAQLEVDHKKPWSTGGEPLLENLQTLCGKCNVGKSNGV
jgi:HNH endonuclease